MAAKNLVIVESPSKAKTIEKFLGARYKVVATKGHLRDLPKSRLGVDIEDNFSPEYINVRGKGDTIKEIREAAKAASKVYLATDPDREGEAISWHICSILGIDPAKADRITFQEITKPAVTEAVKNPRPVDMELVDAQQGRRVIDRVVGYKISPLLWAKVSRGLSAGRVQSAALKIICDRESEIEAFIPREYWTLTASLTRPSTAAKEKKDSFTAKLEQYRGKKLTVTDSKENARVRSELAKGSYSVGSIEKKQIAKKPYAPYTTSVLQQDASIRLNFTPKKTMMLAQELYEGVNVKGHGTLGLITYIRTDSVRISDIADAACKDFINGKYGEDYLGNNFYTNRKKGAQDAHEAIRPSYVELEPSEIKDSLTADQYKLYKLIWSRFVASRMKPALYDGVTADIVNGDYVFKASGRKLAFDGYLKVYSDSEGEKEKMLPELETGDALKLLTLDSEQKFTEPPSRFTEASLIKELEDKGIGRPSTYAPIVTNLLDRRYIFREKKTLAPTELGMRITREIMEVYFREIVDVGFTASMEEKLDKVEEGDESWQNVVSEYYHGYMEGQLRIAENELNKIELAPVLTGEMCPECGKPLAVKHGRFGDFVACTGFPGCKYTRNIVKGAGVSCPKCGKEIVEKRSRKGKLFFGCSGYPDCDQVYWYRPVDKKCPKCGSLLVSRGKSLICSKEGCGYYEKKGSEE